MLSLSFVLLQKKNKIQKHDKGKKDLFLLDGFVIEIWKVTSQIHVRHYLFHNQFQSIPAYTDSYKNYSWPYTGRHFDMDGNYTCLLLSKYTTYAVILTRIGITHVYHY